VDPVTFYNKVNAAQDQNTQCYPKIIYHAHIYVCFDSLLNTNPPSGGG
jgi:hypothetical protein